MAFTTSNAMNVDNKNIASKTKILILENKSFRNVNIEIKNLDGLPNLAHVEVGNLSFKK